MKISKRGLDELIKPAEGYLEKQPDGSCKAYRCPAGVLTCGWGCTEGVTLNTHWTVAEAEAALAREMERHERSVLGLVQVPLNQGQFDALVSLCYNVGAGALKSSTLLVHLNAGDTARAASHFADFKKARVQGATAARMNVAPGTLVTLPGLVTRRAAEARMFLEAEPAHDMPQAVVEPATKMRLGEAAVKVGGAALATGEVVRQAGPAVMDVPDWLTGGVKSLGAWQAVGKEAVGVATELSSLAVAMRGAWPALLLAAAAAGVLAFLKSRA